MSVPPPHAMSETEYEAIEAVVAGSVRGRRFLDEYARRNRVAETRELLAAMARLEAAVAGGRAPPAADLSIRLLKQRIEEIAGRLGDIAREMRAADVEEHLIDAVEAEARAVAGLTRVSTRGAKPAASELPPQAVPRLPPVVPQPAPRSTDARLAALAPLEALTLTEKMALFR